MWFLIYYLKISLLKYLFIKKYWNFGIFVQYIYIFEPIIISYIYLKNTLIANKTRKIKDCSQNKKFALHERHLIVNEWLVFNGMSGSNDTFFLFF